MWFNVRNKHIIVDDGLVRIYIAYARTSLSKVVMVPVLCDGDCDAVYKNKNLREMKSVRELSHRLCRHICCRLPLPSSTLSQ